MGKPFFVMVASTKRYAERQFAAIMRAGGYWKTGDGIGVTNGQRQLCEKLRQYQLDAQQVGRFVQKKLRENTTPARPSLAGESS